MNRLLILPAVLAFFCVLAAPAAAQIPETFTNLQVLPDDIPRGELIATMRSFSMATGFRCEGCHYDAGGTGSFRDIDFASDENPVKLKARFMVSMLQNLNNDILPSMENRGDNSLTMTCKTCHRGQNRPILLSQELLLTTHESGADSAVARYRELREQFESAGAFDFGEWETNGVAEQLAGEGRIDDAITIMEMNAEFHPESPSVQATLGSFYEMAGNTEAAIAAYEKALELGAPPRQVQGRLEALRGN